MAKLMNPEKSKKLNEKHGSKGIILIMIITTVILAGLTLLIHAAPPVPCQIDGHVSYNSQPVIGAVVDAYIDSNSNSQIDSGETVYSTTLSIDVSDNSHDGYFRITINSEDFKNGQTDIILSASSGNLTGQLYIENIEEGTSMDNNIMLKEANNQNNTCTTDQECEEGEYCNLGSCEIIPAKCNIYWPTEMIEGWNLIGFPSCISANVSEGLSSINGSYKEVFALSNNTWLSYSPSAPEELQTLKILDPLQGLFIDMYQGGILRWPET